MLTDDDAELGSFESIWWTEPAWCELQQQTLFMGGSDYGLGTTGQAREGGRVLPAGARQQVPMRRSAIQRDVGTYNPDNYPVAATGEMAAKDFFLMMRRPPRSTRPPESPCR